MAMGFPLRRAARRRRAPMAEINVTPLVDVMLVLLIIFMVTAPLLSRGRAGEPARQPAKALEQEDQPVALSIDANGAIFIDDDAGRPRPDWPSSWRSLRCRGAASRRRSSCAPITRSRLRAGDGGDGRAQPRRIEPRVAGHHSRRKRADGPAPRKPRLGIAALGHVALFGLLSVGFLATPNPNDLKSKPIEVSLTDEIALESGSPTPNADPSRSRRPRKARWSWRRTPPPPAPPDAACRDHPAAARRARPRAAPGRARQAATRTSAAPREEARPTPPRRTRLDSSIGEDLRPQTKAGRPRPAACRVTWSKARPTTRHAAATPPRRARPHRPRSNPALAAEIVRQLKPHWSAPHGADADQLVTIVSARLNRDGSLAGTPQVVSQTGVTDSNRAQADLHKPNARVARGAARRAVQSSGGVLR